MHQLLRICYLLNFYTNQSIVIMVNVIKNTKDTITLELSNAELKFIASMLTEICTGEYQQVIKDANFEGLIGSRELAKKLYYEFHSEEVHLGNNKTN
jgi:hypothetical protein